LFLKRGEIFMMDPSSNDYRLGLIYCMRNDIESAYFYLMRAARAGHEGARETLEELKEKNLLPLLY
jgi:TPR repeat protein